MIQERMHTRFCLVNRGIRGSTFYIFDKLTKTRTSLNAKDLEEAKRLLNAKNEACIQPEINLQIAKACLTASDPDIAKRTWQHVMTEMLRTKTGVTGARWDRAIKDHAFDSIRHLPLLQTRAVHFLDALEAGRVATNVFLRRIHNFALDVGWLPCLVLPKTQWPVIRFGEKRAITWDEHLKILDREVDPEKQAYYDLAWHLGASQTDLVDLTADNIDWENNVIAFRRKKTNTPAMIRMSNHIIGVLRKLSKAGPLFPHLRTLNESVRGDHFHKRCASVGVSGVTLHSCRYAWAERAKAGFQSSKGQPPITNEPPSPKLQNRPVTVLAG